jgi:hypothetical protein
LLGGCAASSSYAGISFKPGAAEPALQELARSAQAGSKQAQLELGIRYEEGRGLQLNLFRARKLYRAAASATGGRQMLHIPSANGGAVRSIPVSAGPRVEGLIEARDRLRRLDHRPQAVGDGE